MLELELEFVSGTRTSPRGLAPAHRCLRAAIGSLWSSNAGTTVAVELLRLSSTIPNENKMKMGGRVTYFVGSTMWMPRSVQMPMFFASEVMSCESFGIHSGFRFMYF